MELRIARVTGRKTRQEVKSIYEAAFRKEERMPFGMMLAMSRLWNTEFLAFYDGDTLCGFVYMAKVRKLVFIMFFAVEEGLRSKGYGSRILERVQSLYPERKIIISFEPCDEEAEDYPQRVRRKRFYLSNGYQETGYLMKLGGAVQEIVVKNGAFDRGEFIRFFLCYSNLTVVPKIWSPES